MKAKLHLVFSITIFLAWFSVSAQKDYWKPVVSSTAYTANSQTDVLYFTLQRALFDRVVKAITQDDYRIVHFPTQSGELMAFRVREAPVFHEDLTKKFPQIRSYVGTSVDGKTKIRFSASHRGLQGMLIGLNGRQHTFIQKERTTTNSYKVYQRSERQIAKEPFICKTMELRGQIANFHPALVDDQTLRKFRIAVSATGEYTAYHGGTVADALAAINATLTRVNEVFETDLAVTLELVPNNDQVIFVDSATDPYNGSLNAQVQNTLTATIGEANYDVGHLFHEDNDNGNAGFIGSVCVDNRKGSAFSSALIPEGDDFDLDYVSHELGHQFGANHTWSFESEGTGVQAEPASGTTIMGYAGIVENNNVAPDGDDYFHYNSIVQITSYLQTVSCAQTTALTNAPPVISPLGNFVIPKSTAFVLEANASDPDFGDVLTYTWEQIDDGVVTTDTFGPENPSGANFRSLPPTVNPARYFPRLSEVVSGNLTQAQPAENSAWETVSDIQRDLNFALTVRDNVNGGGQSDSDLVNVQVIKGAGPFTVTSQTIDEVYEAGSVQTITWDVANTNSAPLNTATVDVFLSTDGGSSFPITLAENIPNDGSADILLDGQQTTQARLMVKASDNIFFAVNASDFTIQESEVVLNFEGLDFQVCQPNDLVVPFVYETYNGFNESSTFSASAPSGLNVSFSPPTATVDDTAVDITFSNTGAVTEGTYPITITSTSASLTKQVVINLNINDTTFEEVVLVSPADLAINTAVNPLFEWEEDPTANSYDIEIATDGAFTAIVESASVQFNNYRSTTLQTETNYFWRVKPRNSCGEGTFGTPFSFTTRQITCKSLTAEGLPIEISEQGTPTITSTVSFVEDLPVADINVILEVNHSFLEDLIISLTSPSGTKVVLTSKTCGDLNNINAVFDDDGAVLSCSGNPAISGTVQPLGELASFNGESVLGDWVLEIEDTAPSDGGSLIAFTLEVCAEGFFRPDDDDDGVFDDGDDLCLGTPKGVLVDTNGCPINNFPVDNFLVEVQSETCRGNNDGSIEIEAMDNSINYTATLIGNGVNTTGNFTESQLFQNLASGTYSLCITGTNGTINFREQCFDLVVEEPDILTVLTTLLADSQQLQIDMDGGSFYTIELNGVATQTDKKQVTVDLEDGENQIKIFTQLPCQGVYEESFTVLESPILFPNPVVNSATLLFNDSGTTVTVTIYNSSGQRVKKDHIPLDSSGMSIGFENLPSGIYYIEVLGETTKKTFKAIKR